MIHVDTAVAATATAAATAAASGAECAPAKGGAFFCGNICPLKEKRALLPHLFFFFVFLAARARSPYGANAPRLARGDVWRRGQCGSADTIRLFFPNTHTRMKAGGGVFKTAALQVLRRERKLMSTGDVTR